MLTLAVAVLVVFRRWRDAAVITAIAAAAWAAAVVIKQFIGRPRPPAWLWLARPGPSASFPSGHAVTAAVIAVIAVAVARSLGGTRRTLLVGVAAAAGSVYAAAVGLSRLYLGDHYPTDVLGGYLTVIAAVLLVTGAAGLPAVRRLEDRTRRAPGPAPPVPRHARPGAEDSA